MRGPIFVVLAIILVIFGMYHLVTSCSYTSLAKDLTDRFPSLQIEYDVAMVDGRVDRMEYYSILAKAETIVRERKER